jgi:hypothetical protein
MTISKTTLNRDARPSGDGAIAGLMRKTKKLMKRLLIALEDPSREVLIQKIKTSNWPIVPISSTPNTTSKITNSFLRIISLIRGILLVISMAL